MPLRSAMPVAGSTVKESLKQPISVLPSLILSLVGYLPSCMLLIVTRAQQDQCQSANVGHQAAYPLLISTVRLQEATLDAVGACTTLARCLQASGNTLGALQLLAHHTASACNQANRSQAVRDLAAALVDVRCTHQQPGQNCSPGPVHTPRHGAAKVKVK